MKQILQILVSIFTAAHCYASVLYYDNFDNSQSLNGFTFGQVGSGSATLSNGQLNLNPGAGYLNRAYAALLLSAIPGYNSVLSSNAGMITYAFNVSNTDGGPNQNNLFQFGISSSPDADDPTGYRYALGAGGYVGDQMYFYRGASSQSPFGPVSQTFISVINGLSTQPEIGAVKITFTPATGLWNLYFQQGSSPVDPLSITTLVGSGVNTGFTSSSLPYLYFESENYGSVSIDNFSITEVPEPKVGAIAVFGVIMLWTLRLRQKITV